MYESLLLPYVTYCIIQYDVYRYRYRPEAQARSIGKAVNEKVRPFPNSGVTINKNEIQFQKTKITAV